MKRKYSSDIVISPREMRIGYAFKYVSSTVWLSSLFVVPILIFGRGLLLRRDVLSKRSFCRNDSFSECYSTDMNSTSGCLKYYNSSDNGQYCLQSNARVILIVIDALRFDFIETNTEGARPALYRNKLKTTTGLLATRPNHTRLFRFIADPPTGTTQRIKGLTTGGLPSYVDIATNFISDEIDEDNIIDSIIRQRKKVVFLGDNTWIKLFPQRFVRGFAFHSFNVWDLDTVDRGIQEHLITEIRKTDWHLMVVHLLGVDHCGHVYGPNHPEMERKLSEMDFIIGNVVEEIQARDDVTLFLIGDHGMTVSGDHGGATKNEVTAALFAYSPVHAFFDNIRRKNNSVSQVDIVPTLATILGVSVPFSNTGRIVLECVPNTILRAMASTAFVLGQNIEQITQYVSEYTLRNPQLKNAKFQEMSVGYASLKSQWFGVQSVDTLRKFVQEYDEYMINILEMCQKSWIQFDSFFIGIGIAFMFLIAFICFIIAGSARNEIFESTISVVPYSVGVLVVSWLFLPLFAALIIFQVFSLVCLGRRCFQKWKWKNVNRVKMTHLHIVVAEVGIAATLFSKNFILEEPYVILFFLILCLWITYLTRRENSHVGSFVSASITYVVGFFAIRCREEQERCTDSSMEDKYNDKYPFLAAAAFIFVAKQWSVDMKPVPCKSATLLAFLSRASMILITLFWVKESVLGEPLKRYSFIDAIPGSVFAACLLAIAALLWDPTFFAKVVGHTTKARIACSNISLILCIVASVLLDNSISLSSVCMVLSIRQLATLFTLSGSSTNAIEDVAWSPIVLWSMSAMYWFYATGQRASFSAIRWSAAFLLQKDISSSLAIPSTLVTMNIFVSFIVHGMLLLFLSTGSKREFYEKDEYLLRSTVAYLKYITISAFRLVVVMVTCWLHMGHSMMWEIFVPKFIFETIAFLITIVSSLSGLLFATRIYR